MDGGQCSGEGVSLVSRTRRKGAGEGKVGWISKSAAAGRMLARTFFSKVRSRLGVLFIGMKSRPVLLALLGVFSLHATNVSALITGGEGNDPVPDRNWPLGSLEVANLETRVAYWEGPPFGGGQYTFEYRGDSTADLNKALVLFAKINAPKRELILSNAKENSFWLGIGDKGKDKDISIDWHFVVWIPDNWDQLFNNPESTFMADHPNFRKPVDPPRLTAFFGREHIDFEKLVVPKGVTVVDQRAKPGAKPSVSGSVLDMDTGKPIAGAKVTLTPNFEMDGPLPGAVAGADGKFVLEGMREGAYTIAATAKGYAPKRSSNYDEVKAGVKRVEEFKLSPVTSLSGVVRDPEGNPVSNARVIAKDIVGKDGFGYSGPQGHIETKSDAEGKFTLEGLPHGETRITVWADGWYLPGSVTTKYQLPPEKEHVMKMIGTGTVKGTIQRLEGKQMAVSIHEAAGEKIGSWGGGMNCKEGGTFEFKNVPAGKYIVGPSGYFDMQPGDLNTKTIEVIAGKTVEVTIIEE